MNNLNGEAVEVENNNPPQDSEVGKLDLESAGDGVPIDRAYKLFLISWVKKNRKREYQSGTKAISESILQNFGVYLDETDCAQIMKEHGGLIGSNKIWSFALSLVTVLIFIKTADSWFDYLFPIILLPVLVNLIHEVKTFLELLYFNPNRLIPSAISSDEISYSTAVIIASRNEPFEVAKMTFDSAIALKYPDGKKEIIVVDNSDVEFHDYKKWSDYVKSYEINGGSYVDGIKVRFLHRDGTVGFKPRNLDIALEAVTADLILYLDVDSTLSEDALLRVAPIFLRDTALGFVQLHSIPTNVRGGSALSLAQGLRNYFLRLESGFYAHLGHSLFYGHNAVWRTKTVREIGSCLEYFRDEVVVTEDLSMSFRARYRGYYGISVWLRSGEWVPESLRETESMWLRWTVGTYQVYAKHFFKPKNMKKMSYEELFGWTQNLGVLINYGLMPIYVALGLIFNSDLLMLIACISLVPEVIQAFITQTKLSLGGMDKRKKIVRCYSAFFILGAFINWVRCVGLFRFISGKKQGWVPTGKCREDELPFSRVLMDRKWLLIYGVFCCTYSFYSFMSISDGFLNGALTILCGLYGFNCIMSVMIFGNSSMQEDARDAVKIGHVRSYDNFYR